MTTEEAVGAVIDALNAEDVEFMAVGSISTSHWGIPRLSKDADFVIALRDRSMTAVAKRLGPAFRLDPQMSFETVTATTRYEISVVDDPFKIEFFNVSGDDHDQSRFHRRVAATIFGRPAFVPTPEDVIITKLRWARSKDKDDVRDVIAVQADRIDWEYVDRWAATHGTAALLDEIRRSIPPI